MSLSHHEAFLRSVRYTNERTKHFEFQVSNGHRFDFQPGQFISLELEPNGKKIRRPYSIASAPRADNGFDLCVNILPEGRASSWLFHLKPGDAIRFSGPFGFFTLREPSDAVSAFIATGTGIAPIRAMLQQLYSRPHHSEVWLIFGVRKEPDILYREEFEKIAEEHPGFHFVPTLSRPDPGWTGHTGYVQRHVVRYLADKKGFHAYICGLRKMIDDVSQELRSMGYDRKALSYEKYD
ncbi:MAG: FAD-dependent oxidoreductase [Acidobacteria bacterium]|nr:FAD-dependent oxidoreductase [Acidobacteriota bacterium]